MECSVCFEVYDQGSHKPVSLPCGKFIRIDRLPCPRSAPWSLGCRNKEAEPRLTQNDAATLGHLLCDACIPALGNDSPSCPTCRLPFSKGRSFFYLKCENRRLTFEFRARFDLKNTHRPRSCQWYSPPVPRPSGLQ